MSPLRPTTIFAMAGSSAPITFYLLESYHEARDPLTAQVQMSFLVGYILFYCIQITVLLKPFRFRPIHVNVHLIYMIFLLFTGLGLINSIEPLSTVIVGLQIIGLILFYSTLKNTTKKTKNYILQVCFFSNFITMSITAAIHRTFLDGDYLFSLLQINSPIFLIGYIFTEYGEGRKHTKFFARVCLAAYLIMLIAGAERANLLNQYRLQASPIIITALIIGLSLFLHYAYLGKTILIGLIVLFYNSILEGMLANRIGSLEERFLILIQMAQDTHNFLVPQGFGSSLRNYNIGEHFKISQGPRGEYPSHSGLASLLYEVSVWTLVILISVIFFKYRYKLIDLSYIKQRKFEVSAIIAFTIWNMMYVVSIPSSKPMETNGCVLLVAILAWMVPQRPSSMQGV